MRKGLRIGVTGGIGTGKSSVIETLRRLGAGTISLDEMAHRLSRPGGMLYNGIVRAFGRRYLDGKGNLNRKALAVTVFSNKAARRRLERVTHPVLLREMRREIARSRKPIFAADVPLLFERGVQKDFDVTLVVSAPADTAVKRVMRRDHMTRPQVLRRMRAQMPLKRKEQLADVVLMNQGSNKALSQTVREYYRAFELIAKAGQTNSELKQN